MARYKVGDWVSVKKPLRDFYHGGDWDEFLERTAGDRVGKVAHIGIGESESEKEALRLVFPTVAAWNVHEEEVTPADGSNRLPVEITPKAFGRLLIERTKPARGKIPDGLPDFIREALEKKIAEAVDHNPWAKVFEEATKWSEVFTKDLCPAYLCAYMKGMAGDERFCICRLDEAGFRARVEQLFGCKTVDEVGAVDKVVRALFGK